MKHWTSTIIIVLLFSNLSLAGNVVVWPAADSNYPSGLPPQFEGDDFIDISATLDNTLALKSDNTIVVHNNDNPIEPPGGDNYTKISMAANHGLALTTSGEIVGWGSNQYGQLDVPLPNNYIDITTSDLFSVGIRADGTLEHWGDEPNEGTDIPIGNNFITIDGGGTHCLALDSAGIICSWGRTSPCECNAPQGTYTNISAGRGFSLAVKTDGSIVAWGNNDFGQCEPPAGNDYEKVSAGYYHGLAIKTDGTLAAWGNNDYGQCDVPDGNDYVLISAAYGHSWALTSGQVVTLTIATNPADMNSVIPSIGDHNCYVGQVVSLNAPVHTICPAVYRFDHWEGDVINPTSANTYITMTTDKTVTAFYAADVRVCGDECHPIQQGDLNGDCRVNLVDFTLYAERYLDCTHPDCD